MDCCRQPASPRRNPALVEQHAQSAHGLRRARGRSMRHLLVVDDDAAVANVMRMGLEADGTCRVTIAPGATEALEAIDVDQPHAAIIDAVLPRIPGLVLARTVI